MGMKEKEDKRRRKSKKIGMVDGKDDRRRG